VIGKIDVLGNKGCAPPKIKDPVQTESCNATGTTRWKAIAVVAQNAEGACLAGGHPLLVAGCMFTVRITYIRSLMALKKEWEECLDSVDCVCP
jgi:hypothetical protein